ncbi:SDR family oxidoreductase, partial [Escherichia coli]
LMMSLWDALRMNMMISYQELVRTFPKAAASHLVRNMAFDLGEKNIRVNGIAPGAILTDALKSVITPEIEQKMLQHTPIRRLGQPQDIANAALFLCSPAASWVSGQILTVSGGGVQELN